MSRTYRTDLIFVNENMKPFKTKQEEREWFNKKEYWDHLFFDSYSKKNRKKDGKAWHKSPKWFKTMHKKIRKAKEKSYMQRKDFDNIPLFKKSNDREWN